jgi:ABC-2 type transport system permease protein
LEILMISPTSLGVIQLGSAVYQAVYVPIRTGVFFVLVAILFDANFVWSGTFTALLVLAGFIPFVWGLGLLSAATTLTVRKGGGIAGLVTTGLIVTSGAYFPVELLPGWLAWIAVINPIKITLNSMRESLLAGPNWSEATVAFLTMVPMSVVTIVVGGVAFRLAVRRELRTGSLGTY